MHGHDPRKKIACLSYSAELGRKLARDYRTILQSAWYRDLFPATRISPEKNTEAEIGLTARGYRLAWSMTGTITGRGADIIIIDDPIKAEDAFSETIRNRVNERFDGTILSRMDNKRSAAIVVTMQRLHPNDLAGHVLAKGGWKHLRLPTIADMDESIQTSADTVHVRKAGDVLHPEREPLALLEQMRREAGEMRFSAQYQPPEGNLVKWAWFRPFAAASRSPTPLAFRLEDALRRQSTRRRERLGEFAAVFTASPSKTLPFIAARGKSKRTIDRGELCWPRRDHPASSRGVGSGAAPRPTGDAP